MTNRMIETLITEILEKVEKREILTDRQDRLYKAYMESIYDKDANGGSD